jgi:MFS family permease
VRLAGSLRALSHRNFRLFLGGQIISLAGTWMQQVALGWLVYRLTRSSFLLGLVGSAGQLPGLVLTPFAGVWADRWNRRRMVIGTQVLAMLQALTLAALVLGHVVAIWQILALSLFLGFINAVDVPARQAFLVQMVEGRQSLANAIALNSSVFNLARLVGPMMAGFLIALVGEGMVFLLNGLSYVAVIGALLAMRITEPPRGEGHVEPVLHNLRNGVAYALGFAPIRAILLLLALVGVVGAPYVVLLPVFATDVLKGGARTLGFLTSATGLGALAGAVFLARRTTVRGLGRVIVTAVTLFGLGLIAFALSRDQRLSVAVLLVAGFGVMVHMAASNTILQTIVEEDKRGRVMSLYALAWMGTLPLGSLLGGALAGRIGGPTTVALGGTACLVGAAAFWRALPSVRRQVRPIYVRLGIIEEVAVGLQSADEPVVRPRDAG